MKEFILKHSAKDEKVFHFQFKTVDKAKRIIEGFASTRFPDRVDDIVVPGAFGKAMEVYMANPVIKFQHGRDQKIGDKPIGKTIEWRIVPDGLWVKVEILPAGLSVDVDEVWSMIEFEALRAFSIGFRAKQINFDGDYPVIQELELMEISVVTIPANRESLFSMAKSFQFGTDLIEKAPPKIGLDATFHQMNQIRDLVSKEFKNMSTESKIFVESFLKQLQNVVNSSDQEAEELERLQLEVEVLKLKRSAMD